MRYPSSEFNSTFSPGPSFERAFTPSPSQSRSSAGFSPNAQTSSSVPSGSLSPCSPGHNSPNASGNIFGGRDTSGMRTFSGSGLAAVAGPSTDLNMATRTLPSRPKVVPDHSTNRNITQDPLPLNPVPTTVPAGIFSNRPHESGSLSSFTETGSGSGFLPRRATNLSEDTEFSATSPVDEYDRGSDRIGDDLFSPDPMDDRNLQDNLNAVKVQLQELSRRISDCPLSQNPETRLNHIYQEAKKLSEFKDQQTRIVGFIGETGAGKSSVINSILNQRGLARSSGGGAACTSVPMEYRYVDQNHRHSYTIEAEFMNEDEVNDLLEELLRSIRRASIQTDRSLIGEEDWEQYEAIGRRSHKTLEAIFSDRSDLTVEYLSRPGAEVEILQELRALALNRLTFRPGESSSLLFTVVADDLEDCKVKLDSLTDGPEDDDTPALWPFIKLIRIFLELPVLKTGLVLADLPGLRDMNHARVRATERYLASTCDEVFVVTGILRCAANQSIFETIKKCGENKRIRVVCTRADEISAEESARGPDHGASRVKKMNAEIKKLETEANRIGRQRQKAQGQKKADLAILESTLEDKIQKLRYERQAFLMKQQNDSTKRELERAIHNNQKKRDNDIKIFCVGNELYGNPPHRLAEEYRNLSGVHELRSYCRSVPAEARMDSASFFIEKQVPSLLLSIHQWTLTGRDDVTSERARELRSALEQVERCLRQLNNKQDFISGQGHLVRTQSALHSTFDTNVMHQLHPYFQRELKEKFVEVSQEWRTLHWASYAAFCRKNGNHTIKPQKPRCWNDELMKQARPALNPRWDAIEAWLISQRDTLQHDISTSFEDICDTLQEHLSVAPQAIENLLSVLRYREAYIIHIFNTALTKILESTESTKDHTLNGYNNSSLIADLMREAYNRCSREEGSGSHQRRKDIMHDHLSNMQLYGKYTESVRSSYPASLNEAFATLRDQLHEQIERIARDLRAVVVPAGEVPEVEKAPELVREFEARLRTLKQSLHHASVAAHASRTRPNQSQ